MQRGNSVTLYRQMAVLPETFSHSERHGARKRNERNETDGCQTGPYKHFVSISIGIASNGFLRAALSSSYSLTFPSLVQGRATDLRSLELQPDVSSLYMGFFLSFPSC
jgi:hypothetical protein